jgi:ferredoxin
VSSIFFGTIRRLSQAGLNEVTIDHDRCINLRYRHEVLCTACQENCVTDAIKIDDLIEIDWGRCIRCGVCAAVCPTEVFTIQEPSDTTILRRVTKQPDGHVRLECDFVNGRFKGNKRHRKANVSKVTVRCVGRFSETFLLQSILAGGDRFEFAECTADCRFLTGKTVIEEMRRRADNILKSFRTVVPRDYSSNSVKISERRDLLKEMGLQAIGVLLPLKSSPKQALDTKDQMPPHRAALLELAKKRKGNTDLLERGTMPFANVMVDAKKCRLHGICAELCPTGALHLSDGNQGKELRFLYGACVGCRICLHACPEGAINMGDTIDWSQLASPWRTLTGRQYRFCTDCGRQFSVKNGSDTLTCATCVKRWNEIERYSGESVG